MKYFLYDFDDVLTHPGEKNEVFNDFIHILRLRRDKKLTFERTARMLGWDPKIIATRQSESMPPNKNIFPMLKLLKAKDQTTGVASNNSIFFISIWLNMYKLTDYFSVMFTPENLNWSRKPDTAYFSKIINILGVIPRDIVFFDDNMENVVAANKIGINGHTYRGGPFKEVTKYLKEQ